jgi:hypothetical protein
LKNCFLSNNMALMYSLGSQKEAWVVEEVTAGWGVYDSTTKVWSEQAGVRVVRYAEEPARRVLQGAVNSNVLNQISGLKRQGPGDAECGAPKRPAVDTNMVQMTNASREKKRKKARYVRTPYTFPPVYATYVHHTHSHLQYTMGMVYGVSTCTSPPKPCAHHPTYTIRTPSHLLVLSARKCEDRQENEASSRPWTCGPCKTMRWWWSRTTQA